MIALYIHFLKRICEKDRTVCFIVVPFLVTCMVYKKNVTTKRHIFTLCTN